MSQYEDIFMAGFYDALGAEKTAQTGMPVLDKALANLGLDKEAGEEIEMPVLDKALGNLGLLEGEEIDMPVLKQAMENLGLLEEEPAEASSMLEALAIEYGPAVAAEREKLAMEKEAGPRMAMAREKARSVYKTLGKVTGANEIREGVSKLREARKRGKTINEANAKAQNRKNALEGLKTLGKGTAKAGLTAGTTSLAARMAIGAAMGKKKKKGKK